MQRQVTACDACPCAEVPAGHVVLTLSGNRANLVTSRIDGGRKSIDLCDECAVALGEWLADRHPQPTAPAKPEAKAPSTPATPSAPAPAPSVETKPAEAPLSH